MADVVCIDCGTPLPPAPQSVHFLTPDPSVHPVAAEEYSAFRYRLCDSCRLSLGPDAVATLETNIAASLEVGVRLARFVEEHAREMLAADPAAQAATRTALSIHESWLADARRDSERLQAYEQAIQPLPPSSRHLLGESWLSCLAALSEANRAAIQESEAVRGTLRRRLGLETPA